MSPDAVPAPLIGTGEVRHRRQRPAAHGFAYPSWFLLLPMRQWRRQPGAWVPRNRRGWVSFHDADHGDGSSDSLVWLDRLLVQHGVADADGEVWLQTYPRVLGYVFKPVSFWYCHRRDGRLAAIVAEVNNTFGQRHAYVLTGPALGWGQELQAAKQLHVSPFNRVEGGYRFRFMRATGADGVSRCIARIDYHDAAGPLLQTSLSGRLAPLTPASLRHAFLHMPLLTIGVIVRIHWQAWRLWCRRVPFLGKHPQAATLAVRPHRTP